MKKILMILTLLAAFMPISVSAMTMRYNGVEIDLGDAKPYYEDDLLMVPVKELCEGMHLDLSWKPEKKQIIVCDELNLVEMKLGSDKVIINDKTYYADAVPVKMDGILYAPAEVLLAPFDVEIKIKGSTRIDITREDNRIFLTYEELLGRYRVDGVHSFYYQSDPEWGFDNSGRGYCWVCSYAMLISSATNNNITPVDVAEYNIENGYGGSYVSSHGGICKEFGVKLVPALDEDSEYFDRYDSTTRGATYLKIEDEEDAIEALKEALDRNPEGVMVRFEIYAHTLVAVGYSGDEIYFYEPAYENGASVTFDKTCLKNYSLTDMVFIQAIDES